MKTLHKRGYLLGAGIVSLGLLLRLFNLGKPSLWSNEIFTLNEIKLGLSQIAAFADNTPPLHALLLHFWTLLFGYSEFSLRSLSVLFGVLAIPVMYKLGKLLFNENAGWLAALLLALSVFHLQFSQEARCYSLMALMTLTSFYFFVRLLLEDNPRTSTGYVIFTILWIYTHICSLFLVLAQNVFVATCARTRLRLPRWILLQTIVAASFAPWVGTLLAQASKVASRKIHMWTPVPTLQSIVDSLIEYSGGLVSTSCVRPVPTAHDVLSIASLALFLGVLCVFLFHALYFRKDNAGAGLNSAFLLLLWFSFPILLPFVISRLIVPFYWTRYTIGASLAFYLLVAKGIDVLRNMRIRSGVLVLLIVVSLLNLNRYYTTGTKEPWREISRFVDSGAQPGDIVVFGWDLGPTYFEHYSTKARLAKRVIKYWQEQALFKDAAEEKGRIWVVAFGNYNPDAILKMLGPSFFLSKELEVTCTGVFLFEKKQ